MKDKIKIIFAVFIFIISLFFIFSQDASAQSCSDGSFRCSNNNQEKCVSGTWRLWNECVKIHPFGPYCGCSNNACVLCQTATPTCTPTTCSNIGKQCGSWNDNCGGTLNCGNCGSNQQCNNGICENIPAPVEKPAEPVVITDQCSFVPPGGTAFFVGQGPFDFDINGIVEFSDFVQFVIRFQNKDASVDYIRDGRFDYYDFLCFKTKFGGIAAPTLDQCLAANKYPDFNNDARVDFADFIAFSSCLQTPNDATCKSKFDFNNNGVDADIDLSCFSILSQTGIKPKGALCYANDKCSTGLYCSGSDGKVISTEQGHCCAIGQKWDAGRGCIEAFPSTCDCPIQQDVFGRFTVGGNIYPINILKTNPFYQAGIPLTCWLQEQICLKTNKYGKEETILLEPRKY